MRIPFRLSIGVKLALASIIILLMAMVPSAAKTSSIFTTVSKKREEDSNRAQAEARASQISVTLEKVVEKMSFYGTLLLTPGTGGAGSNNTALFHSSFDRDPDLVSLEIRARTKQAGIAAGTERFVNDAYLKTFSLTSTYLGLVDRERPFPAPEAFDGTPVLRNRSLPKGAPLISIAVPVAKDADGRVSHVAFANIKFSTLQRAFAESNERTVFLVDSSGTTFAHSDEKQAIEGASVKDSPIFKAAIRSKFAGGQLGYYKKSAKEHFISAYSKLPFGLIVISEASESILLETASYIKRQVFYYTCLVLSCALLVVSLLSLTITRPIGKLVLITKEIARGNFNIPVARAIAANDEVGTLAVSFDAMLAGLRERDKVKNLFNKFHGSSVAESLLASDTVGTGGTRKKLVVFFSDIRGFTAQSESTSPEQVVSMLNEYFTIMVRIILANHGIVDKFIGDAIMAVWGTPKGTPDDTFHAVKACLEMRQALADLNEKRVARGESALMIGMGVHAGDAISGNIGSEERMEFTVIGDTVNMASRIEAATKAFGADLLLSAEVAAEVEGRFILKAAGASKVYGKAQALKLFRVLGFIENGQERIVKTPFSDYHAEHVDKVEVV